MKINLMANPKKTIQDILVRWLVLSAVYYMALSLAAAAVPKRIEWIVDSILPAAMLTAFFVALSTMGKTSQPKTVEELITENKNFGFYGALILVVVFMISTFFSPMGVTRDQLRDALNHAPLTNVQKQEILSIIESENVVTIDDLEKVGLNPTQIDRVVEIVSTLGYVRPDEVVKIVHTETANMATATAIALESTCYIEPKNAYASVSIRQEPKINIDNAIAYLARGERVRVIGRLDLGTEVWWKIELRHGIGSVEGWVISWPVNASNEVACGNVPILR